MKPVSCRETLSSIFHILVLIYDLADRKFGKTLVLKLMSTNVCLLQFALMRT